ncbi:hypothetical protein [Streptomyces sp. NPDC002845]
MTNIGIEPAATADWLDQHGMHGAATLIRRMAAQQNTLRTQVTDLTNDATRLTERVQGLEDQNRTFAERLGTARWIPDTTDHKLYRWAGDWWELSYRARNPEDDSPYTGWYLAGPVGSGTLNEWMAHRTSDATKQADRFIDQHVAQDGGPR